MPLVDSLLTAIVRSDGDALVLHVGRSPTSSQRPGRSSCHARGSGSARWKGCSRSCCPPTPCAACARWAQWSMSSRPVPPAGADRFTVVAARGGDDIWIEVRRHRRVRPPPRGEGRARRTDRRRRWRRTIAVEASAAAERRRRVARRADRRSRSPTSSASARPPCSANPRRCRPSCSRPSPVPIAAEPVLFAASVAARAPIGEDLPVAEPETPVAMRRQSAFEPASNGRLAGRRDVGHRARASDRLRPAAGGARRGGRRRSSSAPTCRSWRPLQRPSKPRSSPAPCRRWSRCRRRRRPRSPWPSPSPYPSRGRGRARGARVHGSRRRVRVGHNTDRAARPRAGQCPACRLARAGQREPYAAPRYDAPAAAVSPRAPMPRVEPTVPEPPVYQPIEPQPTLPGLPPSFDDAAPWRGRAPTRCPASSCR